MARDPDALKISKWAATGDVEDPEDGGIDRSIGWDISHSQPGGSLPKREHINQILRELSAQGVEVNVHGAGLEWDSSISYEHPALVTGSDALLYLSVQDSTNVDPVTDSGESHWSPLNTSFPSASTTQRGIVELATNAEAAAGISASKVITPAGLSFLTATTARRGLVELATNDEVSDGTDATIAITPATLASQGFRNIKVSDVAPSSGPHHQDSGEAKIRESTAGVSRKPSSDCKARGCSSKHLCGLTAWNT